MKNVAVESQNEPKFFEAGWAARIDIWMGYRRGLNNKLANMEAWTSLLKQEAGVADGLEMSCRCVDRTIGVNQETAPPSLETDRQMKDRQGTEGEG